MRQILYMVLLIHLYEPAALSAQFYSIEKGQIVFNSNAPREDIHAESKHLIGIMNIDSNNFAFTVDINTFYGFNSELQQVHFYENYLQTFIYPNATFTGKLIDKINPSKQKQKLRAKGKLVIHGIKQERIIDVMMTTTPSGYHFQSDFNVRLEDHDIKIPKIVYEKIAENVNVLVTGEMEKK